MINQVQHVSSGFIYEVWDKVVEYFNDAIEIGNGDCTVDQLKVLVIKGFQTLLISINEGEINGAMTIEMINYPNARVAFITAMGGRYIVDEETFSQVEHWAKSQGATKVQALASPAQARLYRQKANFSADRFLVEKTL
jgi:hypothetical protein